MLRSSKLLTASWRKSAPPRDPPAELPSDHWSVVVFGIADPVLPLAGAIPCEALEDSVIAEPDCDIAIFPYQEGTADNLREDGYNPVRPLMIATLLGRARLDWDECNVH